MHRTAFLIAVAALLLVPPTFAQPAAQPGAPDPRTTIPEKVAPPEDTPTLSERLDRSGGVIPPPADPGPGIVVGPPETGAPMPVIPPPGSPGGDPSVQPK
jgi:hypothetical protein